jgi:DNA-directed RNA polymerase specialized sigma24 family protein
VAVDIAGLSCREAARVLGTREATIAGRLFRARQRLAGHGDQSFEFSPAAATETGVNKWE